MPSAAGAKSLNKANKKKAFTMQDVAEAAAISVPMVRKLIRQGILPAVRIGRCVRIPKHAVMKLCGNSE